MKKIDYMLTAFRDGIQSAYGSRVSSADYLPVVEACARAGVERFESGGAGVFQPQVHHCGENPFEVMDAFRRAAGPGARLQTLSRALALVGVEGQGSEAIRLHASLLKKHGVDAVRNFDALNDIENLVFSGARIREAGLSHELAIAMTELPPDSGAMRRGEFYLDLLRRVLDSDLAFDSLCFKDASGTCTPQMVNEVVRGARRLLGAKARLVFHGHDTAGLGVEACIGAIEAGIDQVDLSMMPCSGGTCQPDVLSLWHALRGTDYTLGIDHHAIIDLEEALKDALGDYQLTEEATRVDPLVSFFPVPGGSLGANTRMLRKNGLAGRYREVVAAMGEAIVKGGMGNTGSPISQFYFQQAFNNVMDGPWVRIAEGYGKLVLGYFGRTPEPPDPEVVRLASAQLGLPPAARTALEINDADPRKGLARARAELEAAGLPATDENVFIDAICHEKGIAMLGGRAEVSLRKADRGEGAGPARGRAEGASGGRPAPLPEGSDSVTVRLGNKTFGVRFEDDRVVVNGVSYDVSLSPGIDEEAVARMAALAAERSHPGTATVLAVDAQISGMLIRLYKKPGDKVAVGETVMVLDSMGIEVPLNSRFSGVVRDLFVHVGSQVEAGAPLYRLSTIVHGTERTVSHSAEALVAEEAGGPAAKRAVLSSPLPGVVLRIYKELGERVRSNESVVVIESMKMETPINSPIEGLVESIAVKRGDVIKEGQALATIATEEGTR